MGSDAFLELSVPPGVTVVVPDYGTGSVEYLRFGPDGVVERNRNASATLANEERYGTADEPPAGPGDPPDREVVSRRGTYAWHDHRIHWMSPTPPRAVDADGLVDLGGPDGRWSVLLVVDGEPTTVTGELRLSARPSPLPWAAIALGVAAAVVALTRTGRATVAAVVVAVAATGAATAAVATWTAAPAGSAPSFVPVALAVVGLVAAIAAAVARRSGSRSVHTIASAAAAATLLTWCWSRWTVLVRAHLPTDLPAWADRLATAAALGVAIALVVALLSTESDELRPKASPSVS